MNLMRRARPVFLQCVNAKADGGSFDVAALRVQLHSTQILPALQLHRTGPHFIVTLFVLNSRRPETQDVYRSINQYSEKKLCE